MCDNNTKTFFFDFLMFTQTLFLRRCWMCGVYNILLIRGSPVATPLVSYNCFSFDLYYCFQSLFATTNRLCCRLKIFNISVGINKHKYNKRVNYVFETLLYQYNLSCCFTSINSCLDFLRRRRLFVFIECFNSVKSYEIFE